MQLGTRLARSPRKLRTRAGDSARSLFHQKKKKISGLTHGDDFVVRGSKESLLELKKQLERVSNQSEHHGGKFGNEHQGLEPENMLGLLYQHDPLESLGLENRNTVQISKTDDAENESSVRLDPDQISKYRSHVARCLFLRQDRADITFAVKESCQRMSDPSQHSFSNLKRLTRSVPEGERNSYLGPDGRCLGQGGRWAAWSAYQCLEE